jgi:hypothetical protein
MSYVFLKLWPNILHWTYIWIWHSWRMEILIRSQVCNFFRSCKAFKIQFQIKLHLNSNKKYSFTNCKKRTKKTDQQYVYNYASIGEEVPVLSIVLQSKGNIKSVFPNHTNIWHWCLPIIQYVTDASKQQILNFVCCFWLEWQKFALHFMYHSQSIDS